MYTRTRAVILLAALLLPLAACSSPPTQEEIGKACAQALKDGAKGTKTSRPDACKGLTQDNYDVLRMNQILLDNKMIDENGNVNLDKLTDTPTP